MITHIVRGTISVAPGVGQPQFIDVPGVVTEPLSTVMSYAKVADPADTVEFKFWSFNDNENKDPRETYLGVRQVEMTYTSTASGPLDVDFQIVFTDEVEPVSVTYVG